VKAYTPVHGRCSCA